VVSGQELVDEVRLGAWLEQVRPGGGPVRVERLGASSGIANALFSVFWGGEELVLRRPPTERITASAGNSQREGRLLAALAQTDVRHPRLVAACDDPEVIGAPFVLMEKVDGFTVVSDGLPAGFDSSESRRVMGFEMVDALAELALVDWRAIGLEGFGKPDGFLERQVDRWLWQLGTYGTRDLPGLDELTVWLRGHRPATAPVGILHGDYSMFNVMWAPEPPPRVAAIVDWDTATIGDPIMDFGHLLARWDEEGEERTTLGSEDIPNRHGLATRAELAERYAARTGWDLGALPYYEALSLFKLGVIMEGHWAKAVRDGNAEAAVQHEHTAPGLVTDALAIARGDRH
jgi:aminoglycoside phosphotransferase (APT) family kinase protein